MPAQTTGETINVLRRRRPAALGAVKSNAVGSYVHSRILNYAGAETENCAGAARPHKGRELDVAGGSP
jgi:hypothetical protein